MAQRTYQIACAYGDGNDANALRADPVFKLGPERKPLDEAADLASAPTFSRLENAATPQALFRMAHVFVEQFIGSYATPPAVIVVDLDHSEDAAQGQQEQIFLRTSRISQRKIDCLQTLIAEQTPESDDAAGRVSSIDRSFTTRTAHSER